MPLLKKTILVPLLKKKFLVPLFKWNILVPLFKKAFSCPCFRMTEIFCPQEGTVTKFNVTSRRGHNFSLASAELLHTWPLPRVNNVLTPYPKYAKIGYFMYFND